MKRSRDQKTSVRVAVVDSDPLRFVGFRALLSCEGEAEFDLQPVPLAQIGSRQGVDVVLLGSHPGRNAVEILSTLKAMRPDLDVVVTGCNLADDAILRVIAAGAKGCVDESAPAGELARAIRIVKAGSVWAPRRVLAAFVERACGSRPRGVSLGTQSFTMREREVLRMLVAGCSNKEIAGPLGIEERTVKAHVAKMMRKVGVPNRILLSVHAVTHSLIPSPEI